MSQLKLTLLTSVFALIISNPSSAAEKIELPEEELARESVLPVFEKTTAVLNRNVETKERFQLGVGAGLEVNEPFFNDLIYGLSGAYHFNDIHGVNVQFQMWGQGLSKYGEQIKSEQGLDPARAPQPQWALIGNYEFVAYYGKISLSKQTVMNLNLFFNAGAMYVNIDDRSTVGLNLGLGQTFFLTKKVGLRVDLKTLMFKAPNPASRPSNPPPGPSDFSEDMQVNNQITTSLVFLL
jgi:outer membrane beta-barrel protein